MRKQILLLLLLSLLSLPGLARVVTGVVTQSSDGEPIIGASVRPTSTAVSRLRQATATCST